MLHRQLQVVTEAAARVHDCRVELELHHGAPPVVNDSELAAIVRDAATDVLGADAVQAIDRPSSGAEDFGRFGPETRVFMMRLGVRRRGDEIHHLHTPRFDVDERSMKHALRIMSRSIVAAMHTPGIGTNASPPA
jgi:metal-dependent amidase/aminoacylase/carboxypeptidase family protein